jgi:polyhydroxybutyrate depolymerase
MREKAVLGQFPERLLKPAHAVVRRRVGGAVFLAVGLLLVMLFSIASASGPWADMPEERWAADYGLTAALASTVYTGFPDGSFRPYEPETLERFVARAGRALGVEMGGAEQQGTPREPEAGVSAPPLTRGEAAVILAEYLVGVGEGAEAGAATGAGGAPVSSVRAAFAEAKVGGALDSYSDAALLPPAQRDALAYLVSCGVFRGDEQGRLAADEPLLRAQAVAVVFRTLAARDRVASGDVYGHMFVADGRRTFLLHIPRSYASAPEPQPVPLVLVFHGVLDTGAEMAEQTGFSELSEEEGFIVAYPDGVGRRWNAGFFRPDSPFDQASRDDVAFVDVLIERLSATYRIDETRVYAAGFSNGGMFSYRLGAERPETFAAIGSVAGTLPEPLARSLEPGCSVPLIAFHGTEDPVVPFEGGTIGFMNLNLLSVDDTIAAWSAVSGSPAGSGGVHTGLGSGSRILNGYEVRVLPDRHPGDGTRVWLHRLGGEGGVEGATPEIELYVIEGGGHAWPGSPTAGTGEGTPMVGRTSWDIDASRLIWSFFEKHPRLSPSEPG